MESPEHSQTSLGLSAKIVIGAVIALALYLALDRGGAPRPNPGIGQKLSGVHLAPLGGDPAPVSAQDLAGRVTLINFWGPWCGPCRSELPHLAAIGKRLAGRQDFLFAAVACGQGNDSAGELAALRQETEECLAELRITGLPTYADPDFSMRRALKEQFGMSGYPFTLLLDRDGIVRGAWPGYFPGAETEIEREIRQLLGG